MAPRRRSSSPLAFLGGAANAIDNPVRRAFLGQLVDDDGLLNAVSLNSSVMATSRVIGPLLGGVLIATRRRRLVLQLNGASYIGLLVALRSMTVAARRRTERLDGDDGSVREGLRYAAAHRSIWLPLLMVALVSASAWNWETLLVLHATDTFGGGSTMFTVMFAVLSVGTFVGAMVNAGRTRVDGRTLVYTAGCVGAAMMAMAALPGLAAAVVLLAVAGIGAAMFNTASNALLQRSARGEYHGRVMAVFSSIFVGTKGIGGALAGGIGGAFGPQAGHRRRAAAAASGRWPPVGCSVNRPPRHGHGAALRRRRPALGPGQQGDDGVTVLDAWADPTGDFATFERLAHERRSSVLIERDQELPAELVERLCGLVFCAPNHKRTVPWQVAVFTGAAREQLGDVLCADLVAAVPDVPAAKVDKTRSKYLRAPAIVVVGCRPDDDPIRHRENLAAVAAGRGEPPARRDRGRPRRARGRRRPRSSLPRHARTPGSTPARSSSASSISAGRPHLLRRPCDRSRPCSGTAAERDRRVPRQRRSSRKPKRPRTWATRSGSIVASSVVSSPAAVVSSSPSGSTTRLSPA